MNEDLLKKQVLNELKTMLESGEEIEPENDVFCEFMKTMILNTYSAN